MIIIMIIIIIIITVNTRAVVTDYLRAHSLRLRLSPTPCEEVEEDR